jgi:hypothetical protein
VNLEGPRTVDADATGGLGYGNEVRWRSENLQGNSHIRRVAQVYRVVTSYDRRSASSTATRRPPPAVTR